MPHIGNHVDAIFLPESVNTSTTLRINGGDLHLDDDKKLLLGQADDLQIYHSGNHSYIDDAGTGNLYIRSGTLPIQNLAGTKTSATFNSGGEQELRYNNEIRFITTTVGIDVTGNSIRLLGPTSGSTYTTSILSLRGFRQSAGGQFSNIDFKNIDANSSNTEYVGARISAESTNIDGGELKFFITPASSTTFTSTPVLHLKNDSNAEFAGNLTLNANVSTKGLEWQYTNGRLLFNDNTPATFGSGGNWKIFHNGSVAWLQNFTGDMYFRTPSGSAFNFDRVIEATGGITTDSITGGSTLTIDPAAVGDNTGTVIIKGDLQVDGTTTTINSTTLTIDDKNIVLASGAADSAAADGAGITIDGANKSLTYEDTNKCFKFSQRLGIKGEANITSNLRIAGNAGGEGNGTTYYNLLNNSVVQPDVTGTAYYNFTQVKTGSNNGTAYTISNLEGYSASVGGGEINADTTITNLVGFNIKNTWTAGTNNYGFRGQIPDGTNRWNVYMDGSAPNYFAGNVGIGTGNPGTLLEVSGTGSPTIRVKDLDGTNQFGQIVSNSGNFIIESRNDTSDGQIIFRGRDDSDTNEYARFDENGRLGIGTDDPLGTLHIESTSPVFRICDSNAATNAKHWDIKSNTPNMLRIQAVNDNGTSGGGNLFDFQRNGNAINDFLGMAGGNYWFTINNQNQNVGIGTTTPATPLEVQSSNLPVTIRRNSDAGDLIYFRNNNFYSVIGGDNGSLYIKTNGTATGDERLRITSGGDILVNHSSSDGSGKLQVFTNSQDGIDILGFSSGATAGGRLTFYRSKSTGIGNFSEVANGDSLGRIDWRGYNDDGTANNLGATIEALVSGDVDSTTDMPSDLVFKTSSDGSSSPSEKLRITSDGNVGIGTNDPSTLLEVSKSANPAVNIYSTSGNNSTATLRIKGARNSNGSSNVSQIIFENNASTYEMGKISAQMGSGASSDQHGELIFSTSNSGTLAEQMRIDNNGNVGINTTNPSAKLQVTTADTTYFKLTSSNLGDRLVVDQYGQLGLDTPEANISARLHITTSSDYGILVEDMMGDTVFEADDGNGHVTVGNRLYIGGTTNYLSSQPSGNYGSIQINGSGKANWEGYSIDGRAVFMHDGSTTMGLYDDVNNHWAIRHIMGAASVTHIRSGNNVDTIVCDGSNNVGIGTATPGHKLNVYGNMVTENGASFGRGTLTADGQNNIYFFSQSATTNQAQSGAFHNKVRILGGSSQTRTLDLYQVDSGGAHIGTSYNSNTLTFDSDFTSVEFDQRVIIDSDDDSGGALRINNLVTNAEHDFYFAQEIVQTLSGSQTTTADREQGGIFLDINSTTTGGDTNHEHRAYGMYVDLDTTGDADAVYGVYSNATATPTTGQTSEIAGIYGHGEDNGGAGAVTNVYGVRGLAVSDNSTSDTNSLFGGHFKSQPVSDTANIGNAYGVYAEIEIPDGTGDHFGDSFVVRAVYDDNDGVAQTNTTYLFHGDYQGTLPTTAYGVYIADNVLNYFGGSVGIGTITPSRGPLHIHQETTGDTQIHMTNSETGTSSSDGFTIFAGGSTGSHSGFVNREADARIRFLMHPDGGGSVTDQMVLLANGNLGLGISDPVDKLHVSNGDAYFERRVGIGTTDHIGYQLSIRNNTAPTLTGGIFLDCNSWSTNTSEYGINIDIDSTDRTNLTQNRTHRGISCDMRVRVAQNSSNTSGTRQSLYGIYSSAYVDDTDNNDGKMYYVWANYSRARVDGVNCANLRGAYNLAQVGDNATGQARTVDNAYGTYSNMVNDGNQTTITNAYGVYSNVNQDDTGGSMTNAYGFYSKLDRDAGTGGVGHLFRGDFDGTWGTKRGIWLTGDNENSMDGTLSISGSKTFRIPHPLPELAETKDLVHVCIEAPAHDLIYRGKSELVDGSATINLDTKFGMTEGTFVALNRNVQCFTSNESDWSAVKGSVSGNILTIECQDSSSTATISWMVVGERQDDRVKASVATDADGNLILEPDKRPEDPKPEKAETPD